MRSWRDEHDARLSLTRANLRSQNDLTAQLKSRTLLRSASAVTPTPAGSDAAPGHRQAGTSGAGRPDESQRHSPVVREHARTVNLIRVTQDVPIGR